jgi:hypothetical protein
MTADEKQRFSGFFPNLDVNAAVVTGEATSMYNCYSWTVGITGSWSSAGPTLTDVDDFYHGAGFVRSSSGTIAVWGTSASNMTHAAVTGEGHGPRWESKYGPDIRFQHGLGELDCGICGRIQGYYLRDRSLPDLYEAFREGVMSAGEKSYLSADQRAALDRERERIPGELRSAFDKAFAAWKSTWFSGSQAISSNAWTRTVGKEYAALVALGPAILPLVVEQLAQPDNFLALQLYDAIQPNPRLLVQYGRGDSRTGEGEQGRARRTVQAWFTNR